MKYYKLLSITSLMLSLFISETSASTTTSSIMVDAKTGNVLYADNADEVRYPASLTKLMTLYITFNALENGTLKLDDHLKVSHTAANRSPSRLGLSAGQTIDVDTAIKAIIVKSANDCATVLGEALAKNERDFAVLMTKTAHELGMKNTTFKNASGLPHSEQKTTARDMAVLAAAIYHHYPQYYAWFSMQEFEYEGKTITGHNNLLKELPGTDGLKTGYTAAAGYNIVTSTTRNDHRVFVVTMGHQQAKERDNKVKLMVNSALDKADSKIDIKALKAEIDGNYTKEAPKKYASAQNYITKTTELGSNWLIQTGAFSSYDKAKSQAEKVKAKLSGKFALGGINVEKFQKNGTAMYRAQVTGLKKNDAQQACKMLINAGQGCMTGMAKSGSAYARN